MRISDIAGIAVKSLKGRWAVLPAAAAAVGVFCLCFAGTVLAAAQQEKSQPFEISVTAEDAGLTENDVAEISKITGVKAASPVLEVPVSVAAGDYTAELTLTGIYPSYLTEKFKTGGVFPESGVMPYIVLNDAACKQFKSKDDSDMEYMYDTGGEGGPEETKAPDIDWLSESVKLQAGEGNPVTAKICGILSGEEEGQQPAAYISVAAAKALTPPGGQTGYAKANVRLTNIGRAESVSKDISALGYIVGDTDKELQAKWDSQEGQMAYLFVTGAFSLLCFSVLMSSSRKISLLEHQEEWRMLKWIGLRDGDIGRIFLIQTLTLTAAGMFIGIVVSTSLSSFLDPDPTGMSIYTLPVPFWIAAASAAVFLLAAVLPALNIKKSISSELG